MKLFLIMLFSFSMLSCNSLAKKILGVPDPALENYSSVKTYAKDNFGEEHDIWVFNDLKEMVNGLNRSFSVPDARFYNQEGYYVNYKKSPEECNAKIGEFMKEFTASSVVDDTTLLVTDFSDKLINTQTQNSFNPENLHEKPDGYILIFWAKYIGKLNKTKTLSWIKVAKEINNNGNKFQLILINLDFLEEWGLTQAEVEKMISLEIN